MFCHGQKCNTLMLGMKCEAVRCVEEHAICPYPEPDQSSPWPPSHFLTIHFNTIIPSTPGSSQWSLSVNFSHKISVHTSPLPIRSACPAYLIVYDLITRIIFVPHLYFFYFGVTAPPLPPMGRGLLIHQVSRSHSRTHHSRYQIIEETST